MKKTLTYLGVGIIPCAILALLFVLGTFDSCSDQHTSDVVQQVDINQVKRQVADSIVAEFTNRELIKLDSMAGGYEREIERLKSDYKELEQSIANQVDEIQEDTVPDDCTPLIAKYDSALVLYDQYTNTLKRTIEVQDLLVQAKDSSIEIWRQKYSQLNVSYNSANLDILLLKDELASKNTWWRRNEKWIYFVGGVIGTGFLLK